MVGPEVEPFLREQGLVAHILGNIILAQTIAVLLLCLYRMITVTYECLKMTQGEVSKCLQYMCPSYFFFFFCVSY